jgi:hypothetical protein
VGEDVTPEEPVVDEAAAGAEEGAPPEAARPEPYTRFNEPTEADFLEADAASERARLAAQRMSWRRRTATGAILSGLALGFQQVFEDKKQDIAVVVETSGEPPKDLPVEAELEGPAARRSVVKIRPWLLGDGTEELGHGTEELGHGTEELSDEGAGVTERDAAADNKPES